MHSLRDKLLLVVLSTTIAFSTAASALAQMQPGDFIVIKTTKSPGASCVAPCWQEIVVQMPPGGPQVPVGTHLDGVPAQIAEGPTGDVWVAHAPRRSAARIDALVDRTGAPIREEQAITAFAGYDGSRITAVVVAADGTMWLALQDGGEEGLTTIYRRGANGRAQAEIRRLEGTVRSLQLASDQCNLMWLQGDRLMNYDSCFQLEPTVQRTFSEPKLNLRLVPDGGFLVTGSGPVERYNAQGALVQSISVSGSEGRAEAIALTPDGSGYWIATTDGYVRRFSFTRSQALETIQLPGTGVSNLATFRGWTSALDGPVAPRELTIASAHGRTVELRWRDLARSETAYEIQARIGAGAWFTVMLAEPGSHAQLTALEPESDYQFRVRTLTPWGPSSWSNVVQARTGVDQPPRPARRRGVRLPGS